LKRVANTYWTDDRLRAQRVASRALPNLTPARELSREIIGTRTEVRRRGGIIPSWVMFGMIILATAFLCGAATMRTRAEMHNATAQYQEMNKEVESLRHGNTALALEVKRLSEDKLTIESAARDRLKMVRANEYVVPGE
jgi:cell division protein FtsB